MSNRVPQRAQDRRAVILICVLVCLAISLALVMSCTQRALRAHREMRALRQQRQTEFLLEAGVQRAAQRLQANEDFTGETWELSTETIPGYQSAQVEINVSPFDGDWPRQVKVVAQLSGGGAKVMRRSYTFPLHELNLLE